nr:thyroid adenoma-associated protein homolog isoform X1 [Procambarus clarkii]XP_045581876.1 thyroid adenoma-associated protein homolog isoform X1 [Procambarus clarkii]XP_045581878.1 thyroid adenoma-associated protein homolog isoform X1 [Procambarus clarkii]
MDSVQLQLPIKGGKIRKSHMEKLILDPPPDAAADLIKEAFNDLTAPKIPPQQVYAVEKLVSAASGSEESAKISSAILMSALLQLKPKVQLRNKIMKSLPSIGNEFLDSYLEGIMSVLICALTDADNLSVLVQGISLVVEDAGALLCPGKSKNYKGNEDHSEEIKKEKRENIFLDLHPKILKAMLQGINLFWNGSFRESSSSIEACVVLQHIQQLMKSSTMYFQQHYSDFSQIAALLQEISELLLAVLSVVRHPSCPLDLRINCGHLLVVIHSIISQGNLSQLVHHVVNGEKPYADLTAVAQLAVINGVLCVTRSKDPYIGNYETCLGVQVLQAVLNLSSQSNDGSIAISTVRVIYQWTLRTLEALQFPQAEKKLNMVFNFQSPLLSSLLDYLWLVWDHFLDSVKHTTKDCFMNLIKILQLIDSESSKYHFLEICKTLLNQLSSRKYRCSAVSCMVPIVGTQTLLEFYPNLAHELVNYMKDPAMASHAAELLEALFTQHEKEVTTDDWQNLWLNTFINLFSKEMQTFGYELLFKKLLFTSPGSLDNAVARLIQCSNNPVSEKLCLLIMCVKIGRVSSHWLKQCHSKYDENDSSIWKCILPYKIIELCLSHKEELVRTAAFSLICESPRSTELFEKYELDLIIDYFIYSITTQSPSYKQHMMKSTKKLLQRIKEGSVALLKEGKSQDNKCLVNTVIGEQASFCKKLFSLMVQNLNCGANNARRGTALLILQMFHDIILGECGKILGLDKLDHDHVYIDTLFCVLNDSFESNKMIALKLLCSVSEENCETVRNVKLRSLLRAASSLASSCRPPDSLSAAYIFKFLSIKPEAVKIIEERLTERINSKNFREILCRYIMESLELQVQSAHESLLKAAASGPMYGNLLCLKVLLSDMTEPELIRSHEVWIQLIQEVLKMCYTISELVAPVVRNSSPEGHLPMDLNPESLTALRVTLQASLGNQQFQEGKIILSQESNCDELVKAQAVSAQMLLLCAWRCIKEVSLILGDLIQLVPLSPGVHSVLNVENIITIGQYFLTQLSETKHRGAFEQSYIGFGRVCERLWQCEEEQLRKLPEGWLKEVLASIQNDGDSRLCSTRRSAGVPFVVQAVLSSEPSVRRATCLKNTMTTLLHLAEESQYDGTDSRIHAFNILRAVYRDTRLGDLVIPYVSSGVKAAIRGYKSTSWAERNAAALLFAALTTRMLGVKQTQDDLNRKNAMSALVFFRRYPELFNFLKDELEAGAAGVREKKLVPALFPTLLLLARLSPAPLEGHTSTVSLTLFTPSVLQCAGSSVLHLRALASHAIIALVPPSYLHQIVNQLCKEACLTDQNKLHGILLCLLKLLKSYTVLPSDEIQSIIMNITSISWTAMENNPCLVTRGCALELFTFLYNKCLIMKTSPVLKAISSASVSLVSSNVQISRMPWSALCQRQAAQFLLQCCQTEEYDALNMIITLITSDCYEVRLSALEHVASLKNHSELITKQLLDRMADSEIHPECRIQIYNILSRKICSYVKVTLMQRDCLTALLERVISQIKEEPRIEVISSLLQFSSAIVTALLSLKPVANDEYATNHWLDVVLSYSTSEHSIDIRLMVAEGISNIMPFLSSHPSISECARLEVYESVVMLLQDDCDVVRDTVAEGVQPLLTQCFNHQQCVLQSTRILPKIFEVIGSIGTPEALTLLLKLALKEDLPQTFGLTQDDDRVFDKGEMNIYHEDILVGRLAARSLSNALASWSSTIPPVFLKHPIVPFLCSVSQTYKENSSVKMQPENQEDAVLSIAGLLCLLEQDIGHIFQEISALTDTSVYCVKNIDVWLVRLGCRSALWRAITRHNYTKSEVITAVVTALQNSIITSKFLLEILDELS